MKYLLTILMLFVSNNGWASIAYVSSSGGNGGSSAVSSTTTAALSTTTGNFILVPIAMSTVASTVTSVTDTAGNTYHQCSGCYKNSASGNTQEDIWYAYNITGNASNVVTVNISPSANYLYIAQGQYSGVKTSADPFQTAANNTANSSSVTSGSFNPAVAGLIVATANVSSGPSQSFTGGYTQRAPANGNGWWENVSGASGSQTVTASWSGNNQSVIGVAAFSPPGGGSSSSNAIQTTQSQVSNVQVN